MKKIIIILISVLAFTACKTDKQSIEYKNISNFNLGNLSKENATMRATILFFNNSDEELNFKDLVLDLIIDGKDIGTIVTKTNKVLQPKAEFSIPIKYTYETNSFVAADHDPSSKYEVKLNGDITVTNSSSEKITATVKYSSSYEYQTKKEIRIEKRETKKEEKQRRKNERKEKRNN